MKRLLVGGAVLALGVAGMGLSQATPAVYKVTGGGQTLVPDGGGAGDQISFTAQSQGDEGSAAKGQFEYHDRAGTGTGAGQTTYHGTVTCVVVFSHPTADEGGMAVIGGHSTDGTPFRIDVTDGGNGGAADMILVRHGSQADESGDGTLCDEGDQPDEQPALDRGNVTIHKEKAAKQ